MEDFKTKKDAYFRKVSDNFDVFHQIVNSNKEHPNIDKIVMPRNEEEVEYADAILSFFIDTLALAEYITDGNLEKKEIDSNKAFNYYVSLINALKNDDETEVERIKQSLYTSSPKEAAKLIFDVIACINYLPDEFGEELMKRTAFDYNDEVQLVQFEYFYNKAKAILNDTNNSNIDFSKVDLSKDSLECIRELHILIEEEMNKSKQLKREK